MKIVTEGRSFFAVPYEIVNNDELSLEAIGLMAIAYSKENGELNIDELVKARPDEKYVIHAVEKELASAGYDFV